MKITYFTLIILLLFFPELRAQQIHSHNDYEQNVPFWKAYAAGAASIEADVHLLNDTLFVAHDKEEIQRLRTFENLYLEPLRQLFIEKSILSRPFQLLIDIKTDAYPSLKKLVNIVSPIKENLYPANPHGAKIVISGNKPNPADYNKYPDFIFFDWQSTNIPEHPEKVALVSLNFRSFSRWNGNKPPIAEEKTEIENIVSKMKALNRPIRFWASPDTEIAWKTLSEMRVNFIGTDKPVEATLFFNNHNLK